MPLKNPVLLDPSQKILSGTGGGRGTIILDSDQIICLRKIIKKDKKKRKKLTQAKYVALSASLPSGLKQLLKRRWWCRR